MKTMSSIMATLKILALHFKSVRILAVGLLTFFPAMIFPLVANSNETVFAEEIDGFASNLKQLVIEKLEAIPVSRSQTIRAQQAALIEFYSGEQRPIWVAPSGITEKGEAAIQTLLEADLWGLNAADYKLPLIKSYSAEELNALALVELTLSQSVVRYMSDARGGRLKPKHVSKNLDYVPQLGNAQEDLLSLQHMPAEFIDTWMIDGHPKQAGFVKLKEHLASLYKKGARQKEIIRTLVNMERWRYLPKQLDNGAGVYVYNNIPELKTRIYKHGRLVFEDKMIVGKIRNQTPVFSDEMEWIEVHPEWNIPLSIKKRMVRALFNGARRGIYRFDCPKKWAKSIRNCNVVQRAGPGNVLGQFKFKFPNMHHVYMHDTNSRHLFKNNRRLFSHGCLRVNQPQRIAEILLEHDKGMKPGAIAKIVQGPKRVHKETLTHKIPVHVTYFTLVDGLKSKMKTVPDYYGHDRRMAQALFKKGHLFPTPVLPKLVSTSQTGVVNRRKKPSWISSLEGF